MYKTHQVLNIFGSCDVEKVHAGVARRPFGSQNLQNTILGLEVDMSKKCRQLWCEAHFQVKSAINSGAIPNSLNLKASAILPSKVAYAIKNKMQPTNPNAHTYVHATDVETHGYAVTQNTFLQLFI